MKYAIGPIALSLGANALVARGGSQCYQLSASGGASGILGQLDDGQNRIGGGHPTGCYCLGNGGFTDSNGRGCILTPPTTQFQCDVGAAPTTGFNVDSGGNVSYNGNGKFYACPVNDNGEWNVYSQPVSGQSKCVEISLSSAGSCGASAQSSPPPQSPPAQSPPAQSPPAQSPPAQSPPAQSPPAQSPPAQSPPAQSPPPSQPSTPAGSCPQDLNGNYQFPHLIVPINSQSPNQAYGTSYNGQVSSTMCSIFNFDIPSSYSGQTCTVVFLFPEQKDLQTSSYTVSGSGNVDFSMLSSPATQQTTWDSCPGTQTDLGSWSLSPGNGYTVASGSCAAGQTVSYKMCAEGDFMLEYFQDYNPSPIGLYIREC